MWTRILTKVDAFFAIVFGVLATVTGHGTIGELLQVFAVFFAGSALFGIARMVGSTQMGVAKFLSDEADELDAAYAEIESLTAALAVATTTIATLESRLAELDAVADEAVEYEADDNDGDACDCRDPEQPNGCHCRCLDCHDTGCEECVKDYVQKTPYTIADFIRDAKQSAATSAVLPSIVVGGSNASGYCSPDVVIAAHAATDDDDDHIPECPVCGDDPDCLCEDDDDADSDELDDLEIDDLDDDDLADACMSRDEFQAWLTANPDLSFLADAMTDDDVADDKDDENYYYHGYPRLEGIQMTRGHAAACLASCPDLSFLADAMPPETTTTVDTQRLAPKAK